MLQNLSDKPDTLDTCGADNSSAAGFTWSQTALSVRPNQEHDHTSAVMDDSSHSSILAGGGGLLDIGRPIANAVQMGPGTVSGVVTTSGTSAVAGISSSGEVGVTTGSGPGSVAAAERSASLVLGMLAAITVTNDTDNGSGKSD
ncbi:unnamed protein product [Protopolystoma xenopodis]|uniref:Uncharacterized protein n=1 Tax=Protopolystoma xenopodis TaxID=117903 RepID=A0A8J8R348_9PLAT|nr:unnamed protein product [Protopolystoma xenopodis]